ncbi:replication endonuclease [Escherichia coli]|nr:replication endonuclease [Escherichia coli]
MAAEYIRDWQQPRHAIGQEERRRDTPAPTSALRSWLDAYRVDALRRAMPDGELSDADFAATRLGRLINKHLDAQEARDRVIAAIAPRARDAVSEAYDTLRLLPPYLRDPLIKKLSILRKKQESERRKGEENWQADRYASETLREIFKRLERTNSRWLTPAYRSLAGRDNLDNLLYLPQLDERRTRMLAAMTAILFSRTFEKLCDGFGASDGEMTVDVMLKTYPVLARMALHLHTIPPHYEALRTDKNRRTEPDVERLPGAILRLTCADWWYHKLWRLRREWREEQLRAAGLVSRETSPYLSKDALGEFRAQREKTRDFLKRFELENEDGFTIDLESVYYAGISNPINRRAEMMTTAKGMELLAEARGDTVLFVTITAPSRFHATTARGYLNPKWDGSTIRDSSDYLVNKFFAALRKKLDRDGLRWYGVRTVEPHHDGTVHWHMLVFTHPDNAKAIENAARDIAIREDRQELGDDITPRFKVEYIDGSKGTPTSYIATYIGKNLDSRAVDGIDPKTGKPRIDDESGKPMAESVEHAIGWARLHRIRQFQFFGIPSRQVWRELRRLACQMARNPQSPGRLEDDAMDAVLAAADAGCFATYTEKQGGVLVPRKDYLIRTAYDIADEPNDYGEQRAQIYGIWSPLKGESSRVCTHLDKWKLVRRKPEVKDSAHENGFDLQGDFVAPWTRGNNCPRDEKTNNETDKTPPPEGRKEQKLTIPEGDLGEWLRSLTPTERKQLTRQLKNVPSDTKTVKTGGTTTPDDVIHVRTALPLDDVTTTVIKSALSTTGEELHSSAALSVHRGARVRLPDGRIVHWDEKSRSLVAVDQPEVNP